MTTDIPDYSNEQNSTENGDGLKKLGQLAAQLAMIKLEELDLEDQLKAKKRERQEYEQNLIPTLMLELDVDEIKTKSGLHVELKKVIRASFPKDPYKIERAFEWLKKNGHDGIIKREFKIQYGRGDEQWAEEFSKWLEERKVDQHASVEQNKTIHASTLKAFVKEQLAEGSDIPLEYFGAFEQKFAEVKAGK